MDDPVPDADQRIAIKMLPPPNRAAGQVDPYASVSHHSTSAVR
ncbi:MULTISPECIES: hypothetical protein [Acidiphilium]|nr:MULTISPECIES: hypothetical protein [Acidiphilium]